MNLPNFLKKRVKKRKRFVVIMEFETEAKSVDEALKLAEKLKNLTVSVKEKNDVFISG